MLRGVNKLPAGQVKTALKQLLNAEIHDPSGRAEANRAGLAGALALLMLTVGSLTIQPLTGVLFGTSGSPWTLPLAVLLAIACLVGGIWCASILGD
jgi:hypothetical protein